MYNVIDFIDNADLFLNEHIETQIRAGKGTAYGAEFFINKNTGRLKGWLGYTLARTERKIQGINFNRSYPARNDHRHKISMVLSYNISETLRFVSDFVYKSGGAITIPKGFFAYDNIVFNYYTERNGYRLPSYNRLDISLTYKRKINKARKWQSEWIFGIHNVYNRKNVFSLYFDIEDINDYNDINATKLYIPGVIPFVTYNFKF
jgi:outer membrane receptor protein involved in Fe transport